MSNDKQQSAPYPLEYEYKMRGWAKLYTTSACFLFCGVLIFLAINDHDAFFGLVLSTSNIRLAYWGSAITCFILGLYIFDKSMKQSKEDRKIIFSETSLSLPQLIMSKRIIEIPYDSITSVRLYAPGRSPIKIIQIKHGKENTEISEMGFVKNETFEEVYQHIKKRASL